MFDDFLSKAAALRAEGQSFATATVVKYQSPVSGKPGDKAIVLPDGEIWGWIGGGCAQPLVVREALKAIADGRPRLVRISPSGGSGSEEGVVDYTMTCHSGGSLDIFIEPVLPKPQILILGRSLVAQTLARLGKAAGYAVTAMAPGIERENFPDADRISEALEWRSMNMTPHTYIVVSTQGQHDEEALEQALRSDAPYVAFVASLQKARKILGSLEERGIAREQLSRVKTPAGLEIGAVSPEEIAVSILAEIVQASKLRPSPAEIQSATAPSAPADAEAKDPICGMIVDTLRGEHKSEYQGTVFYFCCAGCKQKFEREPERYIKAQV
jgi:xanthine dehydrogenase accessory factor